MDKEGNNNDAKNDIYYECNGKVLLVGGYCVLTGSPGLVFATDSIFRTRIILNQDQCSPLIANFKQFKDGKIEFFVQDHLKSCNQKEYKYFQKAIESIVHVLSKMMKIESASFEELFKTLFKTNLLIEFEASADFYGKVDQKERFPYLDCYLNEVSKSGLGSSSAFVCSLVGAIFKLLNIRNSNFHFRMAQFVHSEIQGKIGSGFDIACNLYSSIIYHRFSQDRLCIQSVIEDDGILGANIRRVHGKWHILLAQVSNGSSTPVMVERVMQWRLQNSSHYIWSHLTMNNLEIICKIEHGITFGLRDLSKRNNLLLEQLGEACNVPIVPAEVTDLLKETLNLEGVLMSGVPGAGGYDAIYCLCEERHVVEKFWKSKELKILPTNIK